MDQTTTAAAWNLNHSDHFARRRMLETEQKRWLQGDKEADYGGGNSAIPDPTSDGAPKVA
jgi:hypothetical protein